MKGTRKVRGAGNERNGEGASRTGRVHLLAPVITTHGTRRPSTVIIIDTYLYLVYDPLKRLLRSMIVHIVSVVCVMCHVCIPNFKIGTFNPIVVGLLDGRWLVRVS